MDRRTSLQAMALSGLALGANPASAKAVLGDTRPVSVVIFDGRYEDCAGFARVHQKPGVLLVDTRQRDIGLAWRDEIAAHLKQYPGRVDGMSLYSDQFVSTLMARDHGLRLTAEDRVAAADSGKPGFFRWTLG